MDCVMGGQHHATQWHPPGDFVLRTAATEDVSKTRLMPPLCFTTLSIRLVVPCSRTLTEHQRT